MATGSLGTCAVGGERPTDPSQMLWMSALSDEHESADLAEAIAVPPRVDRRRPGRIANVSTELIPLLRGRVEPSPRPEGRLPSDLAAATGIAVGLLISGVLWALILLASGIIPWW